MRLNQYLQESYSIQDIIDKISHFNSRQLEDFLKKQFKEFMDTIPSGVDTIIIKMINKAFGTNYRFLQDIYDAKVPNLRESSEMNEDLSHWWKIVSTEGFGALSFYPALNVWLEIDKLLRGQDINMRVVVVYSLLWVLLISGKYIKGWNEWRKQNPDEYNKERQQGKGGII